MIYETIVQRTPIKKGWSGDRKYCATTTDGKKFLLRIASQERHARTKAAFERMQEVCKLGISMPEPLEIGTCPEGIYTIQSWIDGEDAETALACLP